MYTLFEAIILVRQFLVYQNHMADYEYNYEFVFFACIFIQDIFLIKKFSCMGNVTGI